MLCNVAGCFVDHQRQQGSVRSKFRPLFTFHFRSAGCVASRRGVPYPVSDNTVVSYRFSIAVRCGVWTQMSAAFVGFLLLDLSNLQRYRGCRFDSSATCNQQPTTITINHRNTGRSFDKSHHTISLYIILINTVGLTVSETKGFRVHTHT
jgi:hypothetical protein